MYPILITVSRWGCQKSFRGWTPHPVGGVANSMFVSVISQELRGSTGSVATVEISRKGPPCFLTKGRLSMTKSLRV